MSSTAGRVLSQPKLLQTVRRLRRLGKRIAFTNGCFDLLHVGHLELLEKVRAQADCLIVGLNSDASVRRLKGPGRPVVPAKERARLLAGLKPVDYVTIFPENTPLRLVRLLQPDILAKGGDWRRDRIVGRAEVESSGGRVLVIPYVKGRSTSRILHAIRKS